MKPSSVSNGISRLSGSSLRTIFPSRSSVDSFGIRVVQLKRNAPQLRADRLLSDPKRRADQKQSTSDDRCSGKRTKAELAKVRRIAAKNHCSHDQDYDGNKRSQHLQKQHRRHQSFSTTARLLCRGNHYRLRLIAIQSDRRSLVAINERKPKV